MRLDDLQVFISVVENRSFSEAARKLHLTQPAVSSIISSIEKSVGQVLIYRQSKQKTSLELTNAGTIFLKYAQRILELHSQMEVEIANSNDKPTGIVIGCGRSSSVHILPAIVRGFKKRYPNIPIDIKTYTDTFLAHKKLCQAECDTTISSFVPDTDDFIAHKFLYDPFVLICPKDAIIKGTLTVNSLRKYPLIIREDNCYSHQVLTEGLAAHNLTLNDMKVVMQVYGNSAVRQAVSMGLGCGFVTKSLAYNDLSIHHDFKIVNIKNLNLDRYIYLVRRKSAPFTQSLKVFWDYVLDASWNNNLTVSK